ncbi:hypothetical protein ACFX1R_000818 [Malus domestica]
MRVMAMVCVFEIGYFGRNEAIDAMLQEGLIEKLVELQRSEHGRDRIGRRGREVRPWAWRVGGLGDYALRNGSVSGPRPVSVEVDSRGCGRHVVWTQAAVAEREGQPPQQPH